MKRGIILCVLLLVAALAFANPFLGYWQVAGLERSFSISESSIEGVGNYTFDARLIVIDGTPWLYYVRDANHIGLVGWVKTPEGIQPALIILIRIVPELEAGQLHEFSQKKQAGLVMFEFTKTFIVAAWETVKAWFSKMLARFQDSLQRSGLW